MINETKSRRCIRCKQEKPEFNFVQTPSQFFPGHRSIICTSCLETMIKQDSLGEVDRLCRYLDIPFDLNKWTQLYAVHKDHTLSAYFNLLLDEHYEALQWTDENERWRLARSEGTIDDESLKTIIIKLLRPKTYQLQFFKIMHEIFVKFS